MISPASGVGRDQRADRGLFVSIDPGQLRGAEVGSGSMTACMSHLYGNAVPAGCYPFVSFRPAG